MDRGGGREHGQSGRYGAPFVLRSSADLSRIESGTYLEGWLQVRAKHRVLGRGAKKAFIHGAWRHHAGRGF
jgi:hypothetical protein